MNKAEILAEIENKIGPVMIVVNLNKPDDPPEIGNWYSAICKEIVGEVGQRPAIRFYVFDEGLPGERAVYQDKTPSQYINTNNTTTVWRDTVQALIDAQVSAANDTEMGEIISVDEVAQRAIVNLWKLVATDILQAQYAVYRDPAGVTKIRKIVLV